jgi:type II secretory pathway pseudopilin PulG
MKPNCRAFGFTLIELLTVITIIMLVMAMALPNFVTMMKGRRWASAVSNIQIMVMRARAFATNARADAAVEFGPLTDNGTYLWLESESNVVEAVDDLNDLLLQLGGVEGGVKFSLSYLTDPDTGPWYAAGGRDEGRYVYHPELTNPAKLGDNARQSERVLLSSLIAIDPDPAQSPNFISYDAKTLPDGTSRPYGGDDTRDIRIGVNGALAQSIEPTICLKEIKGTERLKVMVVRCTGRVMQVK